MSRTPLVSACLRSYGRPVRTKRMLECILNQNFSNFELLFMGDNCPVFSIITKSDWFKNWQEEFRKKGNQVYFFNALQSTPKVNDWGARITNIAIKMAVGKYFLFLDNDDIIHNEHILHYYNSIAYYERNMPKADFVYNKMLIYNAGNCWEMDAKLEFGSVGHGSIIVDTEFLKKMPPHEPVYGQDWILIQNMMASGHGEKGKLPFPTYKVMSNPNQAEPGMESDI